MINPNFFTKKVEEGSYGKFVFEPLPLGFGHSIGHALRRTILSSLKGGAITNIKIDGASHLFSTLPGVKESVLDIVLNMKQLRFNIQDGGPYKINIDLKGEKIVTAKDIEGEIKPVDTSVYLAEITDPKAKLSIEAIVETGYGYSSVEEREEKKTGYIPVDAFFSPIKKVNIKVEETRVGRKANFEKLTVEIWTDGSLTPSDAISQSSRLLANYYEHILSGRDEFKPKVEETGSEVSTELDKKYHEVIIDELNLPSRVINALLREKIETVADLVKVGKDKLVEMKGVGKKSIQLIDDELKKMGISVS